MWKAIALFFKNLFAKSKNEKVKETVRKIMDVIRKAVNHPGMDVLVSLTPTNIDNQALEIARAVINGFYVDIAHRHNNSLSSKARFGSVSVEQIPNDLVAGISKLPTPDREIELDELERRLERELKAKL